jgi:hypothetical protein
VVLGVIDELAQEVGNEVVLFHPFLRFRHQTLRRLVRLFHVERARMGPSRNTVQRNVEPGVSKLVK